MQTNTLPLSAYEYNTTIRELNRGKVPPNMSGYRTIVAIFATYARLRPKNVPAHSKYRPLNKGARQRIRALAAWWLSTSYETMTFTEALTKLNDDIRFKLKSPSIEGMRFHHTCDCFHCDTSISYEESIRDHLSGRTCCRQCAIRQMIKRLTPAARKHLPSVRRCIQAINEIPTPSGWTIHHYRRLQRITNQRNLNVQIR